jgi:predicted nucleic-acid-binding protein
MRAIDTNVLVRLLVQDDPKQAALASEFVAGGAWVSHLVLAETVWVLTAVYERTAPELGDAIALLLEHDLLVLQDPDVVSEALDDFRARPALGFSDCLVLSVARKAGHVPLGTFDRKLSKLGGAIVVG